MHEHFIKYPQNCNTSRSREDTMIGSNEMRQGQTNITQDPACSLQNQEASSELRDERQNLFVSNICEESEINSLRIRTENAERALQQLREEYSSQSRTLQQCQLSNFSLRPMPQVSLCEVMDQYDLLCRSTDHWVMGEMFHFEHRFGYEQEPITDGGNPYMRDLLESIPVVGEYLVSALIHTHVQQRFFGEDLTLFGLSESMASFFHETEISMAKLEPPRGGFTGVRNDNDRISTDFVQISQQSRHGDRKP